MVITLGVSATALAAPFAVEDAGAAPTEEEIETATKPLLSIVFVEEKTAAG